MSTCLIFPKEVKRAISIFAFKRIFEVDDSVKFDENGHISGCG